MSYWNHAKVDNDYTKARPYSPPRDISPVNLPTRDIARSRVVVPLIILNWMLAIVFCVAVSWAIAGPPESVEPWMPPMTRDGPVYRPAFYTVVACIFVSSAIGIYLLATTRSTIRWFGIAPSAIIVASLAYFLAYNTVNALNGKMRAIGIMYDTGTERTGGT